MSRPSRGNCALAGLLAAIVEDDEPGDTDLWPEEQLAKKMAALFPQQKPLLREVRERIDAHLKRRP